MRCNQARRLLARMATLDLAPPEERRLKEHLSACAGCSTWAAQLARAWQALDHYPEVEVSPDFIPRFRARILAESRHSRTDRPWWAGWRWAAAAAGILAAAVLISQIGYFQRSEPDAAAISQLAVERDQRDELFLQDLEQTLQTSAADFLSAYDSWPGEAPERVEDESVKSPASGKIMKKEPS
jgi:predicted anti-sigma-YlaC factor YlaD